MQLKVKNSVNIFLLFLFSIIVTYIPWEGIRNYKFIDLERNIERYKQYTYLYKHVDFSLVTSEPLWRYITHSLSHTIVSGEVFYSLVAIFCFFVFSSFIYIKTSRIAYCLLLINPTMLDFVLSQQRSCVALAILICLIPLNKPFKYCGYIPAFLIHTLSAVLIFINEVVERLYSFISESKLKKLVFSLLIAFLIAFLTVYGRAVLLGYFNDRRADEYEAVGNSIIYALPWLMYSIMILWKSECTEAPTIPIISAIYLMVFFWVSVFDFYGSRYLAIGLPYFYIALKYVPKNTYLVMLLSIHQLLLLYIWLKI